MDKLFNSFREMVKGSTQMAASNFVLRAEEEEELVDPQEVLRDECRAKKCEKYKTMLDECNDRVNSRKKTTESCMEELIDLFHCVDHCAAKPLFEKLK